MATTPTQIDPKLLDILRCPVAVHYTDKGDDPGTLEIVGEGYWLYSADSNYKYPIINGIPKMLIEEGEKWKDTSVTDLPVPPPNEPAYAVAEDALSPEMQELAGKLTETADGISGDVSEKLRNTAASIDSIVDDTSSDSLRQTISTLTGRLRNAADTLEGKQAYTPAPHEVSRPPYAIIVIMFVLGIFVGIWMRSSTND
ncbi:MAG: hypothetical protein AAF787_11155 [Chloroflexota bacterium]